MIERIYKYQCPKCNSRTEQRIASTSRNRGAKLQCLSCWETNPRYLNFRVLEKHQIELEKKNDNQN